MTWLITAAVAAYRYVRSMRGNAPVACVSTAIDRRPLVVHPGHGCVVASRDGESRPFALVDGLEESVRPLARLAENVFEEVR